MHQAVQKKENNLFVVKNNTPLKKAMEIISANHQGAVAVVDEQEKLVGILSDGDIRRALLRDSSLITPVEKIMNVNYIFYQEGVDDLPEEIFKRNKGITILPFINKEHKLIDILIR